MGLTTSESSSVLESGAPTQTTSNSYPLLPHPVASPLPEEPLITIERTNSWNPVDLRELWAYRELLFFLTWRDIKVRYKQTMLGVLWVIIQPLVMMLIFSLLFGRLAGLGQLTGGIPYPIFAFAGLLPWTFFASAVTNSSNSLIGSTHLITKVYFPRIIIPAAAVGAALVDFALAFVILAALMIYYRVDVTWTILILPAFVTLVALFALGVGIVLSAINVKYRDVRHALPFGIQIWMFASPVIYPTTMVPENWRWVLALNPMTAIIEGFRTTLLGRASVDWSLLAISALVTLILLICSAFVFRRMEKSFADVI